MAIQSELGLPVKYIGIGEKIDDLQKFHAEEFINALFDVQERLYRRSARPRFWT